MVLSKTDRVKKEIKRLNSVYFKLELKTKKSVKSIIENNAFMAITLEDLQEIININGMTEKYQNGANQFGVKKSAEIEIYNVVVKNYMASTKQLTDLLPKAAATPASDGFDKFVSNRD